MNKTLSRERLIREIEMYVDYNPNIYAKIAFYSDLEVQRILENIYKRWEEAGRRGIPLDFATMDELKLLASKALKYKDASARVLLSLDQLDRMAFRSLTSSDSEGNK